MVNCLLLGEKKFIADVKKLTRGRSNFVMPKPFLPEPTRHWHENCPVPSRRGSRDVGSWRYYEAQQENLGKRFLASVREALNRIRITPLLYPVVEVDMRRCITKTFPFGVLFRNLSNQIVIIAVMHLHRDPEYWKGRLT